jgi:hypothetical protein
MSALARNAQVERTLLNSRNVNLPARSLVCHNSLCT